MKEKHTYTKYYNLKDTQKIDIVYTYVNNTDTKWQKKYFKYSETLDKLRFNYNGEIFYSLLTIQKFFNWVNKIYIIHDNQKFSTTFLDKDFRKKIIFIDHINIIPKKYLPTFNSRVIECFMWKIEGLCDYFTYFNDDVFLGNYLYYSDFFTYNNILKDYSFNVNKNELISQINIKPHFIGKVIIEKLFNDKYKSNNHISFKHTCHNFNKYACEYAFYMFNNYLKKTFEIRIRKYNEFNMNLESKKDFCFLTLSFLMQHHLKLSIQSNIFSFETSNVFNDFYYNKLVQIKPKIINLNTINEESLDAWNKLQNNYLMIINDNDYNNLIKKIENDINKEK